VDAGATHGQSAGWDYDGQDHAQRGERHDRAPPAGLRRCLPLDRLREQPLAAGRAARRAMLKAFAAGGAPGTCPAT
jgi:hypothetical protein